MSVDLNEQVTTRAKQERDLLGCPEPFVSEREYGEGRDGRGLWGKRGFVWIYGCVDE
jgi:hypothetical protein